MAKLPDRYAEERRQEILDAARRVFVDKGYDNATMNDIAAAADLSAGSIYRYFENKRDLIAAASNACIDEDLEVWSTELPEGITPGEAFLALGQQTKADFAAEGRTDECVLRLESYLACYRDAELRDRIVPKMEESVRLLADFVRAAQDSGEFDASIDAEQFARLLHAFGAGTGALSVLYGPTFDTDVVWDQLIRMASLSFTPDFRSRVQNMLQVAGEATS